MMNENIKENLDLEELEDFDINEEITYLVCALGYDENNRYTGCEIYLKEFKLPDEAIAFAKTIDLAELLQYVVVQKADISETAYFSLEVESVVKYEDSEAGDENVDTIWSTQINIG